MSSFEIVKQILASFPHPWRELKLSWARSLLVLVAGSLDKGMASYIKVPNYWYWKA